MKDDHCGDIDYTQLKRRSFFGRLLFGVATITGLAGLLTGLRVLSPNVLYETPKKIKVGMPKEIQVGVTYFKEAKAFVFKELIITFSTPTSCSTPINSKALLPF